LSFSFHFILLLACVIFVLLVNIYKLTERERERGIKINKNILDSVFTLKKCVIVKYYYLKITLIYIIPVNNNKRFTVILRK
jgi:hypothetical protein